MISIRSNYKLCERKLLRFKRNQFINRDSVMRHLFLISSWGIHPQEAIGIKCFATWSVEGDLKIWFVARSMFLTDHWNIPAEITRWITASLVWDMLDTLFCYLSFNRQLIALLSVRCLRSTLHSVTHSPWPHCVSNGWGKRRQTLTQ